MRDDIFDNVEFKFVFKSIDLRVLRLEVGIVFLSVGQ